jgi:hypothetical protein
MVGRKFLVKILLGAGLLALDQPVYDVDLRGDLVGSALYLGNRGGLALQLTSLASGTLVDTAPDDSLAALRFEYGDPNSFLGIQVRIELREGGSVYSGCQILGAPCTAGNTVQVPEPGATAAALTTMIALALAARRASAGGTA